MSYIIQCFECGNDLGSLYYYINSKQEEMNKKIYEKTSHTSKLNIHLRNLENSRLEKVFQTLNIKRACCRMHLITKYESSMLF